MIEDRELDAWREQWSSVTVPVPRMRRQIEKKIRHEQLRFVLENVVAAIFFVGGLIFAVFVHRDRAELGTGWALGVCVLMFLTVGLRLWAQRGTWRAETQSTRAYLELWRKRLTARIGLTGVSAYLASGWLVFCAVLTVINWKTMSPDFKAHPAAAVGLLAGSILLLPLAFFWRNWYQRRKLAELREVERILNEMNDTQ